MFDKKGFDDSNYNVDNFEFIKKTSPIVGDLIEYQLEDFPNEMISQKQAELNDSYDAFTKKHGLIMKNVIPSPIAGGDGNLEYLALFQKES